jgi:thiol-disulfide isomerase/thioredoxin
MMDSRSLTTRRFLVLSALLCALSPALRAINRGGAAPSFNAKTLDGERITNDTVKGKVVLIQFWTTWCRYCRRDQPSVDEFAGKYADKGLVVIAVNVGESRKKVRDYLSTSPREAKVVLMEDTNLGAVFNARGFPYYIAIDAKGRVAGVQAGSGGREMLRELIGRAGLRVG